MSFGDDGEMQLWSLLGNSQRLDGGAMFGNAPRALWQRWATPDDANRIPLACRCLLVEDGGRHVLYEAGIGSYMEPKLRDRFGVMEEEQVLLASLAAIGKTPADIDVIVLSHLHFDHVGGLLAAFRENAPLELVFPNAHYVVSQAAWERACDPHPRDRASFIPGLTDLLLASGRLERVPEGGTHSQTLGDGVRFHYSDGHTPGLMLAEIASDRGPLVFAADLIPGVPWVHLPITMGYDRFPERLIDEKRKLLEALLQRSGWLFFTHDPQTAAAKVAKDDRGRFTVAEAQATLSPS